MEKQCKVCNSPMELRKGVKKETGKPWAGYFCQNRECKEVEWIRTQKPNGGAYRGPQRPSEDGLQLLMEEIQGVNKRLDSLAKYLDEQFKKKSGEYDQSQTPRRFTSLKEQLEDGDAPAPPEYDANT